jgi:proteasome lid subunit RPN8/RPN11
LKRITLPPALYSRLIEEARAAPKFEVCGLLGGHGETCTALYPVKNVAPDPNCAFYMDPQEQIAAMSAMRSSAEKMLGIYHSHPTTAARPSARDLAGAAYPGVAYVIISLRTVENPTVAAFLFIRGGFEPMSLVIDPSRD